MKQKVPRDKYDPVRLAGVQFDDADRTLLGRYKWVIVDKGKPYVCRSTSINGRTITVFLHRELMNAPRGLEVDHIDGDGLNNRRANLRLTDRSGNNQNLRRARRDSQTGLLGVAKAYGGKFKAVIGFNGKTKALGTFETAEMAHQAYLEAKRKYHTTCSI